MVAGVLFGPRLFVPWARPKPDALPEIRRVYESTAPLTTPDRRKYATNNPVVAKHVRSSRQSKLVPVLQKTSIAWVIQRRERRTRVRGAIHETVETIDPGRARHLKDVERTLHDLGCALEAERNTPSSSAPPTPL